MTVAEHISPKEGMCIICGQLDILDDEGYCELCLNEKMRGGGGGG